MGDLSCTILATLEKQLFDALLHGDIFGARKLRAQISQMKEVVARANESELLKA